MGTAAVALRRPRSARATLVDRSRRVPKMLSCWRVSCCHDTLFNGATSMPDAFLRINFVRDELHQLQAVTAYCVKCREERAPVVASIGLGTVSVRCPICQTSSMLIVSEHDGSRLPWA
jgi:hypothetical protein